jgi:hypothetical protein
MSRSVGKAHSLGGPAELDRRLSDGRASVSVIATHKRLVNGNSTERK